MGHENAKGMALIGVHVERPVRLGELCTVIDVHDHSVRFGCPQKSDKLPFHGELTVRLRREDMFLQFTCQLAPHLGCNIR